MHIMQQRSLKEFAEIDKHCGVCRDDQGRCAVEITPHNQ